jgi:hypothetical protein
MAGLEPARAFYGPTDFKSVAFPNRISRVDNYLTNRIIGIPAAETPVITVTGKAFFDVGHSLKDQRSNRRSHLPGYAAWEIHPVMKLNLQ